MKKLMMCLALAVPGAALADTCPPSPSDWDDWGWIQSGASGDAWMTGVVCASQAKKQSVIDLVKTHLGLAENWDSWDHAIDDAEDCNPDTWGGRLVNGATPRSSSASAATTTRSRTSPPRRRSCRTTPSSRAG
jgi:hypothetical protein